MTPLSDVAGYLESLSDAGFELTALVIQLAINQREK
jgi:hypothetical protein